MQAHHSPQQLSWFLEPMAGSAPIENRSARPVLGRCGGSHGRVGSVIPVVRGPIQAKELKKYVVNLK
ncbi:MAG TPA: hypothetical protein VNJ09_00950 [Chthonomonadales bacterium]|nr:hypothetical protein [Chthonomonadales bacterium]